MPLVHRSCAGILPLRQLTDCGANDQYQAHGHPWTSITKPHIVDPFGIGFISMVYFLVSGAVALALIVVVVAGVIAKLREMEPPNWR
ncbi:hypothetical protein ASC80_06330 [Afipia sp. Root123D2]|nr:hypothetical protein ASC80_06330 [Afipia sp. Root123D2]